ncbi:hypothetical protein [Achromobacter sp.]|uniref:hypothetical protein n=1 Tax=Achromobacter sp. TaxID=134375 RepID=UPI002F9488B6
MAEFNTRCAAAILSQKAYRQAITRAGNCTKTHEPLLSNHEEKSPKNANQTTSFGQDLQFLARIATHLFHMKFHTTRREDSYISQILILLTFGCRRNAGRRILRSRRIDYLAAPFHQYSN